MGQYGTATGVVAWYNPTTAQGEFLALTAGDVQAKLASDGITAIGGSIGSWTIAETTISSTSIILDTADGGSILVGASAPRILIDGTNKRVESTDFASGTSGFRLDGATGDAEFNNVAVRGAIMATALQYGQVLATAGSIWVVPAAGKTATETEVPSDGSAFTIDIEDPDGLGHAASGSLWTVNDVVRMKEPLVGDVWAKIGSKSDQTTFWRLAVTAQNTIATPLTFTSGATVLNYGQSGAGWLRLTADATNSPYLSIGVHAGSPWATMTERARLGNLSGISGASGYGLWTDNGFFTGSVTANAGAIAGWTIESGHLYAGTGGNRAGLQPASYPFYAGSETPSGAPFRVTPAGALTATSGRIGGWALGANALTSGSGSSAVGIDSGGTNPAFYAGSETPSSAPFRVTPAGALTATDVLITAGEGNVVIDSNGFVLTYDGGSTSYVAWKSGDTTKAFISAYATNTLQIQSLGTVYVTGSLCHIDQDTRISGDLVHQGAELGFFQAGTSGATKQTVTGSRGSNAALESLLTALATYGLITDSSS